MRFLFTLSFLVAFSLAASAATPAEILAEINSARTNPKAYAAKIQARAGQFRSQRSVAEAVAFLNRARSLPALDHSTPLSLAAQSHVAAQGATGRTGHGSMARRLAKQGSYIGLAGENISYGLRSAEATVAAWIVDEGIPGKAHRRNIFRSGFTVAGAATGSHARFGTMCVMDFAGGFAAKGHALALQKSASFSDLREM
jgi:uncharacterized protein YkwD